MDLNLNSFRSGNLIKTGQLFEGKSLPKYSLSPLGVSDETSTCSVDSSSLCSDSLSSLAPSLAWLSLSSSVFSSASTGASVEK